MESAEIMAALGAEPADAAGIYTAAPPAGRRCAFEKCDDPACYFCVVMPARFRIVACGRLVDAGGKKGVVPCRLVAHHHGVCKPSTKRRTEKGDTW
jgi:hypothetical protein